MHDAAASLPPQAPAAWADYLSGYRWQAQREGCSAAAVHRLDAARRPTLFVKHAALSEQAELPDEIARLRWLHGAGIDCPQVLNETQGGGRQWLLMSAVAGDTLSALAQRGELEPERLVRLVAAALRRLHDLDPAACPFDHRLERRLESVRRRVEAGLVEETDFDDEHRGRSAVELYRLLLDRRPAVEDLVVTHGDACLPNLLAEGRRFSGFIDCGRLGVADRHQDLALAARDIETDLGAPWAEAFLEAYGGDIDGERLAYFRLLDEFF
ncbi:APH(3')-II family aminoglycoside O-phosphotransferase [Pseudomonas aeruginosa]|nr:APH(3')-II family aminoglycoside O-phosphotransferase [Pseudomonas aeruginosa]